MADMTLDIPGFYKNKKVFITGHTGFKGTWLCSVLLYAGADITGYALPASGEPSMYALCGMDRYINSIEGDIRDAEKLKAACLSACPDIVLHLAAQPIVREGYRLPAYTYGVNVMGTVNILEAAANACDTVRSFLNVTTDKVYSAENKTLFSENDVLDGFDPYSNSKSCSELITACYKRSCDALRHVAVSTARAGNVIGGGDFAPCRIIPDCIRAAVRGEDIAVRNPMSGRPYQYVLDALFSYLVIAAEQYGDMTKSGCYNVGPVKNTDVTTGELVDMFCREWGGIRRIDSPEPGAPKETGTLRLDCSLLRRIFGDMPETPAETAVEKICAWTKAWLNGEDLFAYGQKEIRDYFGQIRGNCL